MTSPRSSVITGMPSARDPQAAQERLTEQIDKMDVLRERYNTASEYMSWFVPAWTALTDRERLILTEYYMGDGFHNGARGRLAGELNYAERHIDRLREKAVQRLKVLLFG
jgi:DNA-directed RNA polymerase specialized sigma subunit